MSYIDIGAIAIILLMSIFGYKRGFVITIMHIAGWIISAIVAIKFYPVLSTYLIEKTKIYVSILNFINDKLTNIANIPISGNTFNLSDFVPLPTVVTNMIKGLDFSSKEIVNATVGEATAKILLDVLSIVAIFLAVKLILFILTIIIDKIVDLPILKQLNQVGGFIVGLIKGLLLLFIILALLVPIIGVTENQIIIKAIEDSTLTKFLYDNNIIFKIIETYIK